MAFRRDDEFEFSEEELPAGLGRADEGRQEPQPADPWEAGAGAGEGDADPWLRDGDPWLDPDPWSAEDPAEEPNWDPAEPEPISDEDFWEAPRPAARAAATWPEPDEEDDDASGLDPEPRQGRGAAVLDMARAHPLAVGLAVVFALAAVVMLSNRPGGERESGQPASAGSPPVKQARAKGEPLAVVAGGTDAAVAAARPQRHPDRQHATKPHQKKRHVSRKQEAGDDEATHASQPKPEPEPEPAPEPEYVEPEYVEPEYVEPEYTAEPEASAPPSSSSQSPPSEEFGFER